MSFTINQAAGAGAGSPSLDDAWLGVDVALSGGVCTVLDQSLGLSVTLTQIDDTTATLHASGRVGGSVRVECVEPDNTSTVRVIEFTRSSLGVAEAVAGLPCRGELVGERNAARGWADSLDAIVQDLQDRVAALEP